MGVSSIPVSAQPVDHMNRAVTSSSSNGNSSQELQDHFLTLLIAQMKNQDPTNPMDNSQLTSQLAQISTLSGIEKLNTTLGMVSGQIDNSLSVNASNMIGPGVMTIKDENGNVVREVDLGKVSAGVSSFTWDGELSDGTLAPDGSYTFTVNATSDGQKIPATSLSYSMVYGVINSRINDTVLLDLGISGTVSIHDVRQIL